MTMPPVAARLLLGIARALAILLCVLFTSSTARAEAYVAGMLGGVFLDNLDDVREGAGRRHSDLSTSAGFANRGFSRGRIWDRVTHRVGGAGEGRRISLQRVPEGIARAVGEKGWIRDDAA